MLIECCCPVKMKSMELQAQLLPSAAPSTLPSTSTVEVILQLSRTCVAFLVAEAYGAVISSLAMWVSDDKVSDPRGLLVYGIYAVVASVIASKLLYLERWPQMSEVFIMIMAWAMKDVLAALYDVLVAQPALLAAMHKVGVSLFATACLTAASILFIYLASGAANPVPDSSMQHFCTVMAQNVLCVGLAFVWERMLATVVQAALSRFIPRLLLQLLFKLMMTIAVTLFVVLLEPPAKPQHNRVSLQGGLAPEVEPDKFAASNCRNASISVALLTLAFAWNDAIRENLPAALQKAPMSAAVANLLYVVIILLVTALALGRLLWLWERSTWRFRRVLLVLIMNCWMLILGSGIPYAIAAALAASGIHHPPLLLLLLVIASIETVISMSLVIRLHVRLHALRPMPARSPTVALPAESAPIPRRQRVGVRKEFAAPSLPSRSRSISG